MEDRSDKALMKEVVAGSTQAFEILFKRYELVIFNFIMRYSRSREIAQDLLQETFTRVWFAAHTFDLQRGHFKGWLYKIALNNTRNEMIKKRYSHHYINIDDLSEAGHEPQQSSHIQPDALVEKSELKKRVMDAMEKLPSHMREIVVLKSYQQLKFWEIAEITDTPEGTLKARYHRAIERLKQLLPLE